MERFRDTFLTSSIWRTTWRVRYGSFRATPLRCAGESCHFNYTVSPLGRFGGMVIKMGAIQENLPKHIKPRQNEK